MAVTFESGGGPPAPAVAYVRAGHAVLPLHSPTAAGCSCGNPCESVGKHPRAGIGIKGASRDENVVRAWSDHWPDMNIGLRTDGLVVLDIDGDVGRESLELLQHRVSVLPRTRTHSSRPGHVHMLFSTPTGFPSSNSKSGLGSPAGLDLRGGSAGYIVAPPSRHYTGGRYLVTDDSPVAPLPAGWLSRLATHTTTSPPGKLPPTVETLFCGADSAYGVAALRSEALKVRAHPVGGRREQLNRSSFRLGRLVAGGELAFPTVFEAMTAAGLSHGFELHTVATIVSGAVQAGLRFPRSR
jgi:hypothetical protein